MFQALWDKRGKIVDFINAGSGFSLAIWVLVSVIKKGMVAGVLDIVISPLFGVLCVGIFLGVIIRTVCWVREQDPMIIIAVLCLIFGIVCGISTLCLLVFK